MRTAVGLGSNLGDRLGNLRAARKAILGLSNVKPPILCSAIYETDPVGCEPGAGKFLNAVVEFDYKNDPARLLKQLIQIEEGLGRRRDHKKMFHEPWTLTCCTGAIAELTTNLSNCRIRGCT